MNTNEKYAAASLVSSLIDLAEELEGHDIGEKHRYTVILAAQALAHNLRDAFEDEERQEREQEERRRGKVA